MNGAFGEHPRLVFAACEFYVGKGMSALNRTWKLATFTTHFDILFK